MQTTPRIDAIGLVSSDLGRTVTFYRVLGCELPDPADAVSQGHLECDLGGVRLAPFDAPWGMRYATVRDPDGVRVDLYSPLATG